jgi:hypothetical protein
LVWYRLLQYSGCETSDIRDGFLGMEKRTVANSRGLATSVYQIVGDQAASFNS